MVPGDEQLDMIFVILKVRKRTHEIQKLFGTVIDEEVNKVLDDEKKKHKERRTTLKKAGIDKFKELKSYDEEA